MIYVDEPVFSKPPRFIDYCHMTADTIDELHAFAAKLGLKRAWFQPGSNPQGLLAHYDLSPGMRAKAVRMGAREVKAMERARQIAEKIRQTQAQPEQPLLFGGVEASLGAISEQGGWFKIAARVDTTKGYPIQPPEVD